MVVVGQGQIARKIDFDAMPFADGDGRKNIEEAVQDLGRGLRGALCKSFAHAIAPGLCKNTTGARFGYRANGAHGKRSAEDAQVMVVDLIAENRIASLV